MEKKQVEQYFNKRLKNNDLICGNNYMIDAEDTIWTCVPWINGGIAYINAYPYESTEQYHDLRLKAEYREDTQWEDR
uniref:Uncharacterized protein n=1 Tax=viral metagenome TaxID=1070528 RepID=A0A6M3JJ03_9ZZZZ